MELGRAGQDNSARGSKSACEGCRMQPGGDCMGFERNEDRRKRGQVSRYRRIQARRVPRFLGREPERVSASAPHSPFGGCEWYKMVRSSLESGNEVPGSVGTPTPLASQELPKRQRLSHSSHADGWRGGARIGRVHGEPTHTPNNRLCGSAGSMTRQVPRRGSKV